MQLEETPKNIKDHKGTFHQEMKHSKRIETNYIQLRQTTPVNEFLHPHLPRWMLHHMLWELRALDFEKAWVIHKQWGSKP